MLKLQVAQKGVNNVLSAVHHHLTTRATGARHLIWWGDSAPGQLKNFVHMHYCVELCHPRANIRMFDRVDAKFPPVGHTFLVRFLTFAHTYAHICMDVSIRTQCSLVTLAQENDRAFGILKRRAKNMRIIPSSRTWMRVAKTAKAAPPFHCLWLEQPLHRRWKAYISQFYKLKGAYKTTAKSPLKLMQDGRWLNFGACDLRFRTRLHARGHSCN